jgi:hypothetical protein
LIQGTALVVGVDGGVDVAEVISAVMVAAVGDGLITLAAVEVDGAQVAVVAPLGVLVLVLAEAGMLVMLVVELEVAGELLLLEALMMTQDGAPLKRWSQHRRVETAGAPVAVGDGFTLNIKVDNY